MNAPLAKFIDWSALQMAYVVAGLRLAPKPKWKLEEALEFLNGPDLIEGIHDLFAERQPIEKLWQKWQQPEIWRLPHGHVSAQLVLGLMDKPCSPDRTTPPAPSRQPTPVGRLGFNQPAARRG
jgi:hypothetical protein